MSVHYSRGLALYLISVGAFNLSAVVFTPSYSAGFAFWSMVVTSVLLALTGVLFLVNPLLKIERHEVQFRNVYYGKILRRYPVSSPADLNVEGTRLYHVPSGKKIISLGFGMREPEVKQLYGQLFGHTD